MSDPEHAEQVHDQTEAVLAERAEAWFAAAGVRRSRRSFGGSAVDDCSLDALQALAEGFRPHADCRVELVRSPSTDVFRGLIGSYGKVTGAPHLLVMIADGQRREAQQHIGYVGEACVLEATVFGLDTCWVAGFFSRRAVSELVTLRPSEGIVAVSPVGHALANASGTERTMRRMAGSHARKPFSDIAEGHVDDWPGWATSAVECARIAPSATNRQPWRFRFETGALVVRATPGELPKVSKALDCGIAMLHAELGAAHAGVTGRWIDVPSGRDIARFEPEKKAVAE